MLKMKRDRVGGNQILDKQPKHGKKCMWAQNGMCVGYNNRF